MSVEPSCLTFDGYRLTSKKGYYTDPEGCRFCFGPYVDLEKAEETEESHDCSRDEQGKKRLFLYYTNKQKKGREQFMALDHALIVYLVQCQIKERLNERMSEAHKKHNSLRRRKLSQAHNAYKPGGLGWFCTQKSFQSRQSVSKAVLK